MYLRCCWQLLFLNWGVAAPDFIKWNQNIKSGLLVLLVTVFVDSPCLLIQVLPVYHPILFRCHASQHCLNARFHPVSASRILNTAGRRYRWLGHTRDWRRARHGRIHGSKSGVGAYYILRFWCTVGVFNYGFGSSHLGDKTTNLGFSQVLRHQIYTVIYAAEL
jgi:hypothetical protein